MSAAAQRILVLGYGNPGRQDDGLGPAAAEAIARWNLPGVTVESSYLLTIEDAAEAALHEQVLFIDASQEHAEPFELRRVEPAPSMAFSSHIVGPQTVLAICEQCYGRAPAGWLLAIRGYEFALAEGLTAPARTNLERALAHLTSCFQSGFLKAAEVSA